MLGAYIFIIVVSSLYHSNFSICAAEVSTTFHFLDSVLEAQKSFLIWMKANLFIFYLIACAFGVLSIIA